MVDKPCGAAALQCPLQSAKCVLPQSSVGPAKLAAIAESPNSYDIAAGRPFSGRASAMFERGLLTIGLTRSDVHWTNAILCECENEADLNAAAKCCRPRLQAELIAAKPQVIMPVGPLALKGVIRTNSAKPAMQRWRGSVSVVKPAVDKDGAMKLSDITEHHCNSTDTNPITSFVVLPTVSPFIVSRMPQWAPYLETDVARAGEIINDGWSPPEHKKGTEIRVALTLDELTDGLIELSLDDTWAFDVETVGLGPVSTALTCFVLANTTLALVVPWSKSLDGKQPWWQDSSYVAAQISSHLSSRFAVTHNGPAFDHIVAPRYGLQIRRFHDTLLGAHAVSSHMKKSLDFCVHTHLSAPPWKTWDHGDDISKLFTYCGRDGLYTRLLWEKTKGELGQ